MSWGHAKITVFWSGKHYWSLLVLHAFTRMAGGLIVVILIQRTHTGGKRHTQKIERNHTPLPAENKKKKDNLIFTIYVYA